MHHTMSTYGMWSFGPFFMLIFLLIIIVPFWFILAKAGYSKWLSLLIAVPFVNLALLYFLAFSNWPRLKDKRNY